MVHRAEGPGFHSDQPIIRGHATGRVRASQEGSLVPLPSDILPELPVLARGASACAHIPSDDITIGHGWLHAPLKGSMAGHNTSTCSYELPSLFKGCLVVYKWGETKPHGIVSLFREHQLWGVRSD